MGPQGSGKGTQGALLSSQWQVPHVATGDILRQVMATEDSPRATEIRRINAGNHVSDTLIDALLFARLSEPDTALGFVLDGYPRNLAQAATLEIWLTKRDLALDKVIALVVPRDVLFIVPPSLN